MINAIQGYTTNNYRKNSTPQFGSSLTDLKFERKAGEKICNMVRFSQNGKNDYVEAFADFSALINRIFKNDGKNHSIQYTITDIVDQNTGRPPIIQGRLSCSNGVVTINAPEIVGVRPIKNNIKEIAPNGYTFDADHFVSEAIKLTERLDSVNG